MKYLFLLLLLTLSLSIEAQKVAFFKGSLSEAVKQAAKENKFVFVDLHADWCKPCKEMERQVFENEAISPLLNAFFVNIKLNVDYAEGRQMLQKTEFQGIPAVVYLDTLGNIIQSQMGFAGVPQFEAVMESAYANTDKGRTLLLLEKAYSIRKFDASFMKQYFKYRSSLGLQNDKLLDTHLSQLPKDSVQTPTTEQVLVDNLSSLEGKAYKYVLLNKQNKRFSRKLEALMNLTFQKAVADKDKKLLEKVLLTNQQLGNDPSVFTEKNTHFELDFYFLTKDYAHFHKSAMTFINQFLLPNLENAASVKDVEAENKVVEEIQNLGMLYFKEITKRDNCLELSNALKMSCEKSNNPDLLMTQAHLLYKIGDVAAAKTIMERAVSFAPKNDVLVSVLDKISKKEL